jgi:hypothetical protein
MKDEWGMQNEEFRSQNSEWRMKDERLSHKPWFMVY